MRVDHVSPWCVLFFFLPVVDVHAQKKKFFLCEIVPDKVEVAVILC